MARPTHCLTMPTTPQKLGFIGLGTMGAPMASHLIQAGHEVFVHTRSALPERIADSAATRCANARSVAQAADVIFTMLPDTPDVEAVLFGEAGVAAGLSGGNEEGYRTFAYTTISEATAYRVRVLTEDGREIGRLTFDAKLGDQPATSIETD